MIINFQVSKSSLKNRVKYLIEGTDKEPRDKSKVDILQGNTELFLEKASLNTYKTKSFNFLISFGESKEELEAKLSEQGKTIQDIYDEIISFLTAGYQKDELNILAIGHADTDNYHIHITIDSRNQLTDTQLYFQAPRKNYRSLEIELWRNLERYVDLRYNLENNISLRDRGKALNEKIKQLLDKRGEYREKTRDEVKEELTNILAELVLAGEINSRDELIEYLQDIEGIEINRIGKDYISLKYGNTKIRLKGGIYSNERFERIKTEIERTKTRDREDIQRELAELERRIEEIQSKRIQRIEERFRTARARAEELERKFKEEIKRHAFTSELDNHSFVNSDRNTGRTIQLQQEQADTWRESNTDIKEREMGQRGELFVAEQSTTVSLHRQRLEKSKNEYLYYSTIAQKLREAIMNFEEKRKAELEAIKSISPEEIIADLGIPCKRRTSFYECRAVWRGDRNPSLSIFSDGEHWKWKDHATGEGGTWIDLYMVARNMSYVEAVRYLRERFLAGADLLTENNLTSQPTTQSRFKFLEIREKTITKDVIKRFLKEHRKIEHIPNWLKEIEYEIFDTETGEIFNYFGFGVKDEAGNYHIRYATDKAKVKERVIGHEGREEGSTYTHIIKASDTVVVVEGFIDAIRAEQLFPKHDLIILNGVENIKKALPALAKYKSVIVATDMDNAGQKVRNIIKRELALTDIYELKFNAKDLDEAVKQGLQIKVEKIERPKVINRDFGLRR